MVPILIHKDEFESSYTDLNFVVWTLNNICSNLILCLLLQVILDQEFKYNWLSELVVFIFNAQTGIWLCWIGEDGLENYKLNFHSSQRTILCFKDRNPGTFLAVQWLRLCASSTGDVGSFPGWGTKIPHAVQPKKNFFI